MRHGGLVLIAFTLIACGGATAATVVRTPGPDEGPPPGGNMNHPIVADTTDASTDPTAAGGVATSEEIVVSGHGFTPQVITRSGTAGAVDASTARDASALDPSGMGGCIGTFPASAQHIIKLNASLDVLRVLVDTPSSDLTLAIHTPDGQWHCNDDSGDPQNGLNPTVELYTPPPGVIEVWVGTYSSYYGGAEYQLGVTEQYGYASDFLRRGPATTP